YKSRLVDSLSAFPIFISCKSPQDLVSRSCIRCGHIQLTAPFTVSSVAICTLVLPCCRFLAHARRHPLHLRSSSEIITGIFTFIIRINQEEPCV
ncbi:hypothetical protein PSTT_07281, partial [Puccinia striiformis]